MQISIIPFIMALICSEREYKKFRFKCSNGSDTVGMCKSETGCPIYSHISIGNTAKSLSQSLSGGLGVNMSPNMAISNMQNTYSIFQYSSFYKAQMLQHRREYPQTVNNLIYSYSFKGSRQINLHR